MRNLHFVVNRISFASLRVFPGYLILMVVLFIGCKQSDEIHQDSLTGRWDIAKAERNGRESSYLRNGYFMFNPDNTMTINITGEDEHGKYTLDNRKLIMEGDKTFEIQSLQSDSLTVKYLVSPTTQFLIYMLKKKDDDQ